MDSGREQIRKMAAVYARKGPLSGLARDIGVGVSALDDFARGQGQLPDAALAKLCEELWGAT